MAISPCRLGQWSSILLLATYGSFMTVAADSGILSAPMTRVVSAEANGRLFLTLDTISLDYMVPIAEMDNSIDYLTLKVSTMQYATDLENLKPVTLSSGNIDYTYFQTPLPLHLARTVCENYRLSPLSITDISRYFHIPYPLLFHFEIMISNDRLTCLTPTMVIPEHQCLDDRYDFLFSRNCGFKMSHFSNVCRVWLVILK